MSDVFGMRFFLSPNLSDRRRRAAESRVLKAGGGVVSHLARQIDYVITTAAECRAVAASARRRRAKYLTVEGLARLLNGSMVVALEHGIEHVLDFATGKLYTRFPTEVTAMLSIAGDDVKKERLEKILAAAGIRTSRDGDGDVVAHAFGEAVNVLISADREFIRFLKLVPVSQMVSEDSRSAAVTQLNNEFDVVRFRLWHDTGICGDYSMPYTHGILPAHIVSMLVGFSWVVKSALESEIAAELLR